MLRDFLTAHGVPLLLAIGEPAHGEPAFPLLRNRLFEELVAAGFRAIAIESDRVAALALDDYVAGETSGVEEISAGFSHGLGALPANQELIEWMRAHNAETGDRLRFHGFDAPLEMTHARSPVPYLNHLREYLGVPGAATDDPRWSDPAAQLDAAHSPGRTQQAADLRLRTDDLLSLLYADAPRLIAATSRRAWHRARLHGLAAAGLFRYHAVAADPAPAAVRASRMLGVRDALMAENLLDIATQGPVLVFAHNRHLQRHPSRWSLAGLDLEWSSAGAIVSALLGDRYAVILGSLGESVALGLGRPAPATFEGRLTAASPAGPAILYAGVPGSESRVRPESAGPAVSHAGVSGSGPRVRPESASPTISYAEVLGNQPRVRTDVSPEQGYFPLDAETVAHCDAILHLPQATPDPVGELAERICRLPEVYQQIAGPGTGAPELSWGDRFFFVGEERMRPFATIVVQNVPGFDERSGLDRPGVFRLNVELGRAQFRELFGYGPEEFAAHQAEIDFTAAGRWFPHPVYAVQGWGSMINPGPEADLLIEQAHHRSAKRAR